MKKIYDMTDQNLNIDDLKVKFSKKWIIVCVALIIIGLIYVSTFYTINTFFFEKGNDKTEYSNLFSNKQIKNAIKTSQKEFDGKNVPEDDYNTTMWSCAKKNFGSKYGIVQYFFDGTCNYAYMFYNEEKLEKIVFHITADWCMSSKEVEDGQVVYLNNKAELEDLNEAYKDMGLDTQKILELLCNEGIDPSEIQNKTEYVEYSDVAETKIGIKWLGELYQEQWGNPEYIQITIYSKEYCDEK